ncbi:MAG: ATP-binding protein [Lachnospiraceae bacterium]|nr:ATP-binding protein [Lachnospiraceae bacterium]
MLLEFKTKNYKSFKEELVFSMVRAQKQKGLDYSLLKAQIGKEKYSVLSSAIVYGPNASGKSNIISAMDTFKNIILRGHIRNTSERSVPNVATHNMELIPNRSNTKEPVSFSIKFIQDEMQIEYILKAELGEFLDKDYKRNIAYEELRINNERMFLREENYFGIEDPTINKKDADNFTNGILDNLLPDELFLMNGYKSIVNAKLAALIANWLGRKFLAVFRADAMDFPLISGDTYTENILNDAARIFGASNMISFAKSDDDKRIRLYSIFEADDSNMKMALPLDVYESYGTVRFANIFPFILYVIANGGVLIVDEFDASIHPMALMSIINIFHDNEINTNKAQLIFNTHNPIFLNSNLFRRDEIKFVERDEETGNSTHYSLSDFKTSGKNGVRKTDDYMKNYFVSRYGAIRDIDFTSIFEKLIETQN